MLRYYAILLLVVSASAQENRLDRLSRWLRSPRASIRLEALTELEDLPVEHALPLLLPMMTDTNASVRSAAAWALRRSRADAAVAALRPLLKDDDEHVRAAAVGALCHNSGSALLSELARLGREDVSGSVRYRAISGLAVIGDPAALPVAVAALGDYSAAVRERAALVALEALADATVGEQLARQATHEFSPTRRLVMYLLFRFGEPEVALPVLTTGLKDPEPLVRAEAALSLGRRHARGKLPSVLPLLRDDDDHVRGVAAYVVGELGTAGNRETLQPGLTDESAFVRAATAEALQHLGDATVKPPDGFKAAELFTYPLYPAKARR